MLDWFLTKLHINCHYTREHFCWVLPQTCRTSKGLYHVKYDLCIKWKFSKSNSTKFWFYVLSFAVAKSITTESLSTVKIRAWSFHKIHTGARSEISRTDSSELGQKRRYPANIYLFKFNTRNTRKRCEISSNR